MYTDTEYISKEEADARKDAHMIRKLLAWMLMLALMISAPAFVEGESGFEQFLFIDCDTFLNGCAGLPITWTVIDVMNENAPEGTFTYRLMKDGEEISSQETDQPIYQYTPDEGGAYWLEAEVLTSAGEELLFSEEVLVSDKLYMGFFEQDRNEKTEDPIEWRILAVEDGRAFVLSEYVLKNGSYFNPEWIKYKYCYWSRSYIGEAGENNMRTGKKIMPTPDTVPLKDGSMGTDDDLYYVHVRKWLNDDFLHSAFSEAEQERILLTHNENADSPYGIEGGPDTDDYIFFLSLDELLTYLPEERDRKCKMTKSALKEIGSKPQYYWLRNNGKWRCNAMYVYADSGKHSTYGSDVGHSDLGYRPAMWISIGG